MATNGQKEQQSESRNRAAAALDVVSLNPIAGGFPTTSNESSALKVGLSLTTACMHLDMMRVSPPHSSGEQHEQHAQDSTTAAATDSDHQHLLAAPCDTTGNAQVVGSIGLLAQPPSPGCDAAASGCCDCDCSSFNCAIM